MSSGYGHAAFVALALPMLACAQNPGSGDADLAAARAALWDSHGAQINYLLISERFEYQSNGGDALGVWEAQGWVGGDINKLWLKTEGEFESEDSELEEAEVQALFSRAVGPFWDFQAGIRHDFRPDPSRSHAVVGFQGMAPYWFEIDSALFLSEEGVLSARLEAEYELRLTQRLILQPRLELNVAFNEDPEIDLAKGVSDSELGLRLRYEIRREFAPYVGLAWRASFGDARDLIETAGGSAEELSFVAGLRFWY